MARSLHQIGIIHQDRGDYLTALELYEKSLRIFEEIGNLANMVSSLHNIGIIHQILGEYQEALQMYENP